MKVTIVAGPPAAGKSTYVAKRKGWNDLVVDLDLIYAALTGGTVGSDKPQGLLAYALIARDAILENLDKGEAYNTWVVTCAADRARREEMARKLGAEVVVLETSQSECSRRINADPQRRKARKQWGELVKRWWDTYKRTHDDKRITA